jgi:hypothetical protein
VAQWRREHPEEVAGRTACMQENPGMVVTEVVPLGNGRALCLGNARW